MGNQGSQPQQEEEKGPPAQQWCTFVVGDQRPKPNSVVQINGTQTPFFWKLEDDAQMIAAFADTQNVTVEGEYVLQKNFISMPVKRDTNPFTSQNFKTYVLAPEGDGQEFDQAMADATLAFMIEVLSNRKTPKVWVDRGFNQTQSLRAQIIRFEQFKLTFELSLLPASTVRRLNLLRTEVDRTNKDRTGLKMAAVTGAGLVLAGLAGYAADKQFNLRTKLTKEAENAIYQKEIALKQVQADLVGLVRRFNKSGYSEEALQELKQALLPQLEIVSYTLGIRDDGSSSEDDDEEDMNSVVSQAPADESDEEDVISLS